MRNVHLDRSRQDNRPTSRLHRLILDWLADPLQKQEEDMQTRL